MKKVLLFCFLLVNLVVYGQNLRFKGIDQKDKTCFWVEKTLVEMGCKFKQYDGSMKLFDGTYAGRDVVIGVSGVPDPYDPGSQISDISVFIDDFKSVSEWELAYSNMKDALLSKFGKPFSESQTNTLWYNYVDSIYLTYTESGIAILFSNSAQKEKAEKEKKLKMLKKHDDM